MFLQCIGDNSNGFLSLITNALCIDVEEWYQTILFNRNSLSDTEITDLPENVYGILSLLDQYNTKATFFIVGLLAKKYPGLIKTISKSGHEIASHGYLHTSLYSMSRKEFSRDLDASLDILNKFSQVKIIGYRAPTWSIRMDAGWVIDILRLKGFRYDSSIYPLSTNLMRCIKLKIYPYTLDKDLIEFPPSVFRFMGYNFPFAGGMFLRFLPFCLIERKIKYINSRGYPAMVYFHPWEFANNVSKLNVRGWKRWVQYGNASSVKKKLNLLLQKFKFGPIKDILGLNSS